MAIPTVVLRKARESAGIRQSEMAVRLGVSSNSVISRLEKSDFTDYAMAERYLTAIDTEASFAILEFYSRDWRITKRPDFQHPDIEMLWRAELALQALEEFEADKAFDELLAPPLHLIRNTLEATAEYVSRTDHSLAWIGAIGIGKTTALSHLTNLLLPSSEGRPQPIFPASGGRTTTSEVVVRSAPAFGIAVEPKSEDEVRLLVTQLVDAVADGKGGVSTEIDRAIRNMAGIQKKKDPQDPKILVDPVKDMLKDAVDGREDVVLAILARMQLDQRTETQMLLSENDKAGLEWLSRTVTAINFGRHPRFSLPERVTVFVPENALRKSAYDLTIIDTKGIHGTTDRRDLQDLTSDPRTLSILCSSFNDAPGQEPLNILKGLCEIGSDAIERQRVMILVLPRADEAIKVIDDAGEPVESIDEGYAFRTRQVFDSLKSANIPEVPVVYFNAMDDGAASVWEDVCGQVDTIRQRQLERLERFTNLADEFRRNPDVHRIQQARATLSREATAIATDYRLVPASVRPAHQRLVRELKGSHPSSIAASALRNGSWYNLDIHYIVGAGVRTDANLRTASLIKKIEGRLDSLRNSFSTTPQAVALLDTLVEDISDWHQEFLAHSLRIGRNTYKPHLDADAQFWRKLRNRYGQGAGYRDDIIELIEEWFEQPELNPVRDKIDERLADAWRELVLEKLVESTEMEDSESGS